MSTTPSRTAIVRNRIAAASCSIRAVGACPRNRLAVPTIQTMLPRPSSPPATNPAIARGPEPGSTSADSPEATQHDDDDPQHHQQDGSEQDLFVPVDGEADRGKYGGPEVEDERRLPGAEAEVEQPVVQVLGIRCRDRSTSQPPAHDSPGRVDDGDREGGHRHDQG